MVSLHPRWERGQLWRGKPDSGAVARGQGKQRLSLPKAMSLNGALKCRCAWQKDGRKNAQNNFQWNPHISLRTGQRSTFQVEWERAVVSLPSKVGILMYVCCMFVLLILLLVALLKDGTILPFLPFEKPYSWVFFIWNSKTCNFWSTENQSQRNPYLVHRSGQGVSRGMCHGLWPRHKASASCAQACSAAAAQSMRGCHSASVLTGAICLTKAA